MLESHSIKDLIESGLIQHIVLTNADIEKKFVGSPGSGLDADAIAHPQDAFIDLYVAYVSVPSIGRNLLDDATWNKLQGRLDAGDQAILVMSKGRYSIFSDDFVRGSTPERILLKQDQLPIEMRDLNLDVALKDDRSTALGMTFLPCSRSTAAPGWMRPGRSISCCRWSATRASSTRRKSSAISAPPFRFRRAFIRCRQAATHPGSICGATSGLKSASWRLRWRCWRLHWRGKKNWLRGNAVSQYFATSTCSSLCCLSAGMRKANCLSSTLPACCKRWWQDTAWAFSCTIR